jgi:hypothetical protein
MKPWVEVAIVGSDTLGKPVGQAAFDLNGCEDRLRLITFKTVNSLNEGDFYNGLASTMTFACAATDTLDAPMNSVSDGLTHAALDWLSTGNCGAVIDPSASASLKTHGGAIETYAPPSPLERWLPGAQ